MADYYARIHPDVASSMPTVDYRTSMRTFVNGPSDQPWLGWQKITAEEASRLRGIYQNMANPGGKKMMQVVSEEEYVDIVKEGRKGASKHLDPIATAQIANLQEELDKVKEMSAANAEKDAQLASLQQSNAELKSQFAQLMAMLQGNPTAAQNAPSPVQAPNVESIAEVASRVGSVAATEPPKQVVPTVTGTPRPGRKPAKVDVVIPSEATAIEKSADASPEVAPIAQ